MIQTARGKLRSRRSGSRHKLIERNKSLKMTGKSRVGEILNAVFDLNPKLRSYVLDDRGALHTHMVVFVNGTSITDRKNLNDVVPPNGEIYVMQALSGG